ncbi:NlpC/P60 family protein [Salinimicrobium sp. GXAS 041]|uniref:C40 family peptidase n=1 Tax=Salinimicrobium sp. GXAS 041 TaxID=3400806 RepID=UPI003C74E96D
MALLFLMILGSCKNEEVEISEEISETEQYIAEVREEYAPDGRVALFDIQASQKDDNYVLKGESNLPEAVANLKKRLEQENISYTDSIQMLPSKELEGSTEGVIKISVANLRSRPSHSAELVTQATLGMPVKVYKKDGGWYYIQTPDGYLAWVDYGGITPMTGDELQQWKASEKLIFTEPYGQSFSEANKESQSVSDVVAGNIFKLNSSKNGFFEVQYPDGRVAYLPQDQAQPYKDWLTSLEQTEQDLVKTSKKMMGAPYLWGGTSPKGVDCSGFTKTVYFLNGTVIPRDASQQVHTGKLIDSVKNFENHRPGDLLFFGRKATDSTKERVVHVGMWIGDNKFIHSMGDVHISTFDEKDSEFDEYNYNRYLRTKRLLGEEEEKVIQLAESDLFTTSESGK